MDRVEIGGGGQLQITWQEMNIYGGLDTLDRDSNLPPLLRARRQCYQVRMLPQKREQSV